MVKADLNNLFVKSAIWLDNKIAFICIVIAILLSLFIYSVLAESVVGFKPEDAGLGLNTKSKIAFYKGRQISVIGASLLKLKNSFHHFRMKKTNYCIFSWSFAVTRNKQL